jgi:hypothetical protein
MENDLLIADDSITGAASGFALDQTPDLAILLPV